MATIDIETTGLNPKKDRIIAIGIYTSKPYIFFSTNEEKLLNSFLSFLRKHRIKKLIGYNILLFDIPFILERLKKKDTFNKIKLIDLYLISRKLYKLERYRLKDVCKAENIHIQDDISGYDIPQLYERGEYRKIISHLKSDIIKTYLLYKKINLKRKATKY